MRWLRTWLRFLRAEREAMDVTGAGSHSWRADFGCCQVEVFDYEMALRTAPVCWRCKCGQRLTIAQRDCNYMRDTNASDRAGTS